MEIITEIFNKATLLAQGRVFVEAFLRDMCDAAYEEMFKRLKNDVDFEAIREKFIRASALLALSMCMGIETEETESFSVGSVSVKKTAAADRRKSAEALRKQAEMMLAGLLEDESFGFRTVRV